MTHMNQGLEYGLGYVHGGDEVGLGSMVGSFFSCLTIVL